LHHYPEPGWCEIRTTSIIAERLKNLGYEILTGEQVCLADSRMGIPSLEQLEREYQRALLQGALQPWAEKAKNGFTGVIGILHCGPGPVIALRFDIDALGVTEETGEQHIPSKEGFASCNPGVMHACGHDGHVAIGLAVAAILSAHRDALQGTVKLIFQPAEEGVRGAKAIADNGHLDDVNYLLANHIAVSNGSNAAIGFSLGATLATTKLDVEYHGAAAHAGMAPEKGNNALLAAATAVLNLQAIPRNSGGESRINVGTLHAGTGRNVIPDWAKLELEVRGATTEVNRYTGQYAERIVKAAAEMHGCSCTITVAGETPTLTSDEEMVALCAQVCREQLKLATTTSLLAGASEDCAHLMNAVRAHGGKGVYFNTISDCKGVLHSAHFDFDEAAMTSAVKLFCGMVFQLIETQ